MHRSLGAVSARLECPVIRVDGVAAHVHCLARQARTITVAEWVKELKRASPLWATTRPWAMFRNAFGVGASDQDGRRFVHCT
jgi:hypothetical protein